VDALGEQFGGNLREQRRRSGLSQERLADLAGVDRTEVSLLERGLRVPRLDTIVKLARALGVPLAGLLSGIA
jgi:transcriptional regulator with XRE-family HTH domain